MDIGIQANTREAFIALGNVLGSALPRPRRNNPFYISLQGDFNSGKELLALAIDQALNPSRYVMGIRKDYNADILLAPGNHGNPQTVFTNFRSRYAPNADFFDGYLRELKDKNPNAHVLIASNISRPGTFESYRATENMQSVCLDVGVVVYKLGKPFTRGIDLTFKDDALLAKFIAGYKIDVEPQGSELVAPPARSLPQVQPPARVPSIFPQLAQ